ncbi:MAG: DUF4230 domain-containing protein [Verrucomicrobia bacterium]|nr:DUF4230 domain-containing protein [Verrucomicrobiota bacterium]
MFGQRFAIAVVVLLLALGAGLLAGLLLPAWLGNAPRPQVLNTATVIRQVQPLAQLVTIKYVLEKVVAFEDVKWYGESRVLLVAHGVVKAGVDLGQLKADDVEIRERHVTLKLPTATITDAYLDEQGTQIIERNTGVLRQFDKGLEQEARRVAAEDIKRAARNNGILKDADERARQQITLLLLQLGFDRVEFR